MQPHLLDHVQVACRGEVVGELKGAHGQQQGDDDGLRGEDEGGAGQVGPTRRADQLSRGSAPSVEGAASCFEGRIPPPSACPSFFLSCPTMRIAPRSHQPAL
jgi:hypothetical protein